MLSPGVVQPVLGELHAEPVVRTAVQARDEALHRLLGEEFKRSDLPELVGLQVDGHGCSQRYGHENAPLCGGAFPIAGFVRGA